MNNKKARIILIVILFLTSLFGFDLKIRAATKLTSVRPTNSYPSSYKYNLKVYNSTSKTLERDLSGLDVFVASNNGKPQHAYCVQPGISMAVWSNGSATRNGSGTKTVYDYTDDGEPATAGYNYGSYLSGNQAPSLKQNLLQVLNYTYELTGASTFDEFNNNARSISNANLQKVIASQALVWEIVTLERTNFNTYSPNQKVSSDLYDLINSKADLSTAKSEYRNIVDAVYYSYSVRPGTNVSFQLESQAKSVEVGLGETYKVYDQKNAFKYFKIKSVSDGLSATISSDGSAINITPSKVFSKDNPGIIKISLKSVKNNIGVFTCTDTSGIQSWETSRHGCQDMAYGGTDIELALKVYTKKYSIKIKKVDEDNNPLSDVQFNICKDSKCANVLNDKPLVSDENGEIEYDDISDFSTYYVQEIKVPDGYEIDNTIKSIKASATSVATVTFTNKARQFELTKNTVDEDGKVVVLDDGCNTGKYTGPEFKLTDENGKTVEFEQINPGEYKQADDDSEDKVSTLKTCDGRFSVKLLSACKYTISETKAPDGLTLPSNSNKSVNICGSDRNISFTNGFTGIEFQKKNEDGEFVSGGKFALQRKINNVYKDVLLRDDADGQYTYDDNLEEESNGATHIIETLDGIARISKVAPGEYRIVEKEAPEGYEVIEDKDSTAKVTIKDGQQDDYYLVELVDRKVNVAGDEASAELIVTITTGRKILNYTLIFVGLIILLVALIYVRKKYKK